MGPSVPYIFPRPTGEAQRPKIPSSAGGGNARSPGTPPRRPLTAPQSLGVRPGVPAGPPSSAGKTPEAPVPTIPSQQPPLRPPLLTCLGGAAAGSGSRRLCWEGRGLLYGAWFRFGRGLRGAWL